MESDDYDEIPQHLSILWYHKMIEARLLQQQCTVGYCSVDCKKTLKLVKVKYSTPLQAFIFFTFGKVIKVKALKFL